MAAETIPPGAPTQDRAFTSRRKAALPSATKLAAHEKKSGATNIAGEAITQAAAPTGTPLTQEPAADAPPPPKAPVAHVVVYPPLERETRSHVPTGQAGYYLGRAGQTMRIWACREDGPIRPIRVHGRLMWPMAGIRALLGIAQ